MFRATQIIQDKTQCARRVLSKDCNAVLDHLGRSLRAIREALVRGVVPLGKDPPFPSRRALRPNAEHGNFTLKDY
ncbi:MAG TPA: hypothetical protein EYQ14_07765 [Gammaproteobacteria bacterium]|nr:hypothetical protein [Gammaproteobacteria bacterium]